MRILNIIREAKDRNYSDSLVIAAWWYHIIVGIICGIFMGIILGNSNIDNLAGIIKLSIIILILYIPYELYRDIHLKALSWKILNSQWQLFLYFVPFSYALLSKIESLKYFSKRLFGGLIKKSQEIKKENERIIKIEQKAKKEKGMLSVIGD